MAEHAAVRAKGFSVDCGDGQRRIVQLEGPRRQGIRAPSDLPVVGREILRDRREKISLPRFAVHPLVLDPTLDPAAFHLL